jgi:hypothetical protein
MMLNATVKAFLGGQNITTENNVSSTLSYEAAATFNFTDSEQWTVTHYVTSANRDDYVGKTLIRGVKYNDEGNLVLAPREKVMGVSFSLLWRPSRVVNE